MDKKIVVIGAASNVFGVKAIQDIAVMPEMEGAEVVLVDINEERVIGVASLRIPFIGWVKIIFSRVIETFGR